MVDNPANLPLDDRHSERFTESDRFGFISYILSSDNFTITKPTQLLTADFFSEKISGSFTTLNAFNVFIMRDITGSMPNVDPHYK